MNDRPIVQTWKTCFKTAGAKHVLHIFGDVHFCQTSRFKIKKKIENSQNINLDHNALIFIFSLKNSLLKLFRVPAFNAPSLLSHGNLGNPSEPPRKCQRTPRRIIYIDAKHASSSPVSNATTSATSRRWSMPSEPKRTLMVSFYRLANQCQYTKTVWFYHFYHNPAIQHTNQTNLLSYLTSRFINTVKSVATNIIVRADYGSIVKRVM